MTTQQILAFDQSLRPGLEVMARWTKSGRTYEARATIAKVNEKSVVVNLAEGQTMRLPRLTNLLKWTANHCVQPVRRLKPGAIIDRRTLAREEEA